MNIGCHVSIQGGIQNAPEQAHDLGCECFQMFTRSPQGGKTPPLTNEICEEFKILNLKFKIKETYIHCPYYINLASASNRIRYGSSKAIREELERGNLIGAKLLIRTFLFRKEKYQKKLSAGENFLQNSSLAR